MIDWPNVLVASFIALLIATVFYFIGAWNSDRKHRVLLDAINAREQRHELKAVRDRNGNIIDVKPVVLKVEPAKLVIQGQAPSLRIDSPAS
jgi:hypothetical protein